jgi:hypothetical protein
MNHQIPCPFVYANGRPCEGHINRIEAYSATVQWMQRPNGAWVFGWQERSHYHLFCSLKGAHAGMDRTDDPRMKCDGDQLPQAILMLLERTDVKEVPEEGSVP